MLNEPPDIPELERVVNMTFSVVGHSRPHSLYVRRTVQFENQSVFGSSSVNSYQFNGSYVYVHLNAYYVYVCEAHHFQSDRTHHLFPKDYEMRAVRQG